MRFLRSIVLTFPIILLLAFSCKGDDSSDNADDPRAENLKSLGSSAEDILSDDIYTSMTVEFVYTTNYAPLQVTMDRFRDLLDQRINKPGGINFVENVITIPLGTTYSLDDIKAIEEEYRSVYTTGNNIALYIFFANGNAVVDSDTSITLGTAYRNTSIVIYEKTLHQVVNQSQELELDILEAATLHHEFGHILGLVNLKDDDIHQHHEDLAHLKHCFVENCLMYYSSNTTRNLRRLGTVPEFDPLCIEDLQAKGGK